MSENTWNPGASSHTGKETMGFLHLLLGKDRVWSHRPKAFQEPGLKIHAPKSCDANICDINGILYFT